MSSCVAAILLCDVRDGFRVKHVAARKPAHEGSMPARQRVLGGPRPTLLSR